MKNILAGIGVLTVAWHTTCFILGVLSGMGFDLGLTDNEPEPGLRLVYDRDKP